MLSDFRVHDTPAAHGPAALHRHPQYRHRGAEVGKVLLPRPDTRVMGAWSKPTGWCVQPGIVLWWHRLSRAAALCHRTCTLVRPSSPQLPGSLPGCSVLRFSSTAIAEEPFR